ncbi:coiled-coil domain-containing protein 151 [Cololabis saira]|uniref:coiled-coil domain-containing protein 151 n=1 Tax=Cololabis saira TaxID=129043 RepID=UPI002AD54AA7|nr:coiled-coil domain-containing protein 151 [Cololabis saira]
MKTSVPVRAGVEHLSRKLQHIHLNQDVAPGDPAPGDADDKVVQLAKRLELQSQVLLRELEGQDLAAARKEMEESEYWDTIQREMPAYNTRVLVPGDQDTDHGSL